MRPYAKNPDSPLVSASTNLSKTLLKRLKDISREKKVPMSILISRAILNELQYEDSFNFNVDISDIPYVEEDTPASHSLFNFIKKNQGLCPEHLMICKDDMEIKTDKELMVAYRHLLAIEMIKEYYPFMSKFTHPPEYRVVKINPEILIERAKPYKEIKPLENPLDAIKKK